MTDISETEKNRVIGGTLYLVATPIGNMADISARAVKVLSEVDFIAAEDTRHTGLLLSSLGISRPMTSYYKDNMAESGPRIIARLKSGESCALCTDAGMPAISDPGEDLVRLAADAGIPVTCIPGASAVTTALALSAADTRSFVFVGFLPTDGKPRAEALAELASEKRTTVIYEAPHRLCRTLDDLVSVCGPDRGLAVCRELTKLNEEVLRTTTGEASSIVKSVTPRGEYVLVLHGAPVKNTAEDWLGMTVQEHVAMYEAGGMARMDAIKAVARDRRVGKGEIYRQLIK